MTHPDNRLRIRVPHAWRRRNARRCAARPVVRHNGRRECPQLSGRPVRAKPAFCRCSPGLTTRQTASSRWPIRISAGSMRMNSHAFRGRNIGIVFQNFHLVPTMTALENVAAPLELAADRQCPRHRTRASRRSRPWREAVALSFAIVGWRAAACRHRACACARAETCSSRMSRPAIWTKRLARRLSNCCSPCAVPWAAHLYS